MFAFLSFLFFFVQNSWAIDPNVVLAELKSSGAELEIHGVDTQADRYVATYRSKTDFFDFQHFALITDDAAVAATLKTLKRHDVISVTGDIPSMSRPFLHIKIDKIKIVTSWTVNIGTYPHPVKLPDDLIGLTHFKAKVHATHSAGAMLVVDYKGSVFPVSVPTALQASAQQLDRGDLIELEFSTQILPTWPIHLEAVRIQAIEHMSDLHAQSVDYEGTLTLFPASPQVLFNVFALQKDLGDGMKREYTIVNFSDPQLFKALREKMQKAWDDSPVAAVNDRNKLIKPGLKIRAKGLFNFIDKGQANPQILVNSIDDISFGP